MNVCRSEFLAKIERRVKEYKIEHINEPRAGKHLLVLDIDYTLFGKTDALTCGLRCHVLVFMLLESH